MRRVLKTAINSEALASIELIMEHLLAIAYKRRRRHNLLDELVYQGSTDTGLFREREDLCEKLD